MIYVHRNLSAVPQAVIDDLQQAASELDKLTDIKARKAYIAANAGKWATARNHLSKMSHDKCWYSEAKESVSRYQVDHFRPHGRAKQSAGDFAAGYCWLAFDLDNYRLAGVLCNTANQEYSDSTVGKADWFPLIDPAARAAINSRDCSKESPVLLDPTDPDDPGKLSFNDDGTVAPDPALDPSEQKRVQLAIQYLGLGQSQLNRARLTTWRNCNRKLIKYNRTAKKPKGERTPEEQATLVELTNELVAMTQASSEFAAVARCCLRANRLSKLIVANELMPLALAA